MRKLMFSILMAFGLVSVSMGVELNPIVKADIEYVKEQVKYLEWVKENVLNSVKVNDLIKEGKLYLELAEAVEKNNTDYGYTTPSGNKDIEKYCIMAAMAYMNKNKDRYRYFSRFLSNGGSCMEIGSSYRDEMMDLEVQIKDARARYDAIIRQKANVMKSGDGALLKDGVTEVGTLSDGTKIEIEKK